MKLSRRQKILTLTIITLVALGGVTSFYLMSSEGSVKTGRLTTEKPQVLIKEEVLESKNFEPLRLAEVENPGAEAWSAEQSQKLSEVLDLKRKVFREPQEEGELERYLESDLQEAILVLRSPKSNPELQQVQEDLVELLIEDMEKNQDVRLALTLVNSADLSGSGSEPELHLAGLVGELLFHAFAYEPQVVQSWASQNNNPIKAKIFENTQRLAERNLQESRSEL
jgi:hypothetical protein